MRRNPPSTACADQRHCWAAVPLTMGRLALYRLPYAAPPPGLGTAPAAAD